MQRHVLCSSARKIKQRPPSDLLLQPAWWPHLWTHSAKHNGMRHNTSSEKGDSLWKCYRPNYITEYGLKSSILSADCSLITQRGKQQIFDACLWIRLQHRINGAQPNIAYNNQTLHTRPIYISEGFSWRGGAALQTRVYPLLWAIWPASDPVLWTREFKVRFFFLLYLRETMSSAAYCKEQSSGET